MTTATRTRKQPERTAKVQQIGASTVLWLTVGALTTAYRLVPLASDFGKAVRLEKADQGDGNPEQYDVMLDGPKSTCECKGYLRHGHCKHVESLQVLAGRNRL